MNEILKIQYILLHTNIPRRMDPENLIEARLGESVLFPAVCAASMYAQNVSRADLQSLTGSLLMYYKCLSQSFRHVRHCSYQC